MKFLEFLENENKNAETYFDEKLKVCKEMEELPRELINCTCCKNHKINFPIFGNKISKRNLS